MTSSRTTRPWLALPLLAILAAACSDRSSPAELGVETPELTADPSPPDFTLLDCRADVLNGAVECSPPAPERGEGMVLDERIVGGQGRYVRLSSSEVTYTEGIFSFDATVRNLADVPMATAEGTERDAKGVRVFFQEPPSATSGSGVITVANPTGVGLFSASDQAYFQYGGSIEGVDQEELGVDGILEPGELSGAKRWELEVPATVESFAFTVLVAAEMPPGVLSSIAPEIFEISPAVLIPGEVASITGARFHADPELNLVTIGGVAAAVTGGNANELEVMVPCVPSGDVAVAVTAGSYAGAPRHHPLQTSLQSVAVGEMVVIDDPMAIACSELVATGEDARYIVSLFSNSTSPASNSPFRFVGRGAPGAVSADAAPRNGGALITPDVSYEQFADVARQQLADEQHARILEENNRVLEQFGGRLQRGAAGASRNGAFAADVSPNRTFRIPNIAAASFCTNYYVVSATRVYFDGKVAIYEDDALPEPFKAANNASMAQYYQEIGDQFNADMEPIIHDYFGDVLRRDMATDNNGVMLALFTPRINNSFPGVAGFVVSCDLFPNDDANMPEVGGPYTASEGSVVGSSNHGEIFYAYTPTVDAPGYADLTPDNWYRTIRSTFIHETKHLASYVARVENGAGLEAAWLEEGTARHSEELWARLAVDPQPWKGNGGYGSAADPINLYCDVRPGWPECDANPRRPASIMQRHFSTLYTHLFGGNARLLSPFGPTASDNAGYYYAISWSLVRYAADRYAVDEATFFQALTQSSESGIDNLLGRVGVSLDQLLAGWTLSLVVDDHPLWSAAPDPDLQIATWNFRDIYAGLNADFPGSYTLVYPQAPTELGFGEFTYFATTMRGGGSLWYELSGEHTAPQLLWIEGSGGVGPAPSTMRMAITRLE